MTYIGVALELLEVLGRQGGGEALEALDVIDVVGIALEGAHGILEGRDGGVLVQLHDVLALDELRSSRLKEGSRLGPLGRSSECQRQKGEESGGTHVGARQGDKSRGQGVWSSCFLTGEEQNLVSSRRHRDYLSTWELRLEPRYT